MPKKKRKKKTKHAKYFPRSHNHKNCYSVSAMLFLVVHVVWMCSVSYCWYWSDFFLSNLFYFLIYSFLLFSIYRIWSWMQSNSVVLGVLRVLYLFIAISLLSPLFTFPISGPIAGHVWLLMHISAIICVCLKISKRSLRIFCPCKLCKS